MNVNKQKLKTFSDSDICRNEERISNPACQDKELAKVIHCFYDRPFFPCSFITNNEQKMERHYKKEHYLKTEEVHG